MSNTPFNYQYFPVDVTIATGETLSAAADLGNHTLSGILVPANMDGTDLTLLASINGTDFYELRQPDGSAYTIDIDTDAAIYAVGPQDVAGLRYIKIKSSSAETPAKTLTLISILAVNKQ